MAEWQATASIEMLRHRAQLLADIRKFFAQRDVLEVETPLLAGSTVTDVHLKSFRVPGKDQPLFLQTSPEYAMKRLLASGSGSIYQICKCFRDEEQGRQHNPEFTMLEWYRSGFTMAQLMDEVEALVAQVLGCASIPRFSYRELFQQHLGIDPHVVEPSTLERTAHEHIAISADKLSDTDHLQLLMNSVIEPRLPDQCFVYDYPKAQAALAIIESDADGVPVAKRFELYCSGMEVANGYFELTDAEEQRKRFEQDQARRNKLGLANVDADEKLLNALEQGLPQCAGVALGVDRLLMAMTGADSIEQVIAFPTDHA